MTARYTQNFVFHGDPDWNDAGTTARTENCAILHPNGASYNAHLAPKGGHEPRGLRVIMLTACST
jgi:hypothetical protein